MTEEKPYRLIVSGDVKTVRSILERLSERFKGVTIKDYLILRMKHQEVLV